MEYSRPSLAELLQRIRADVLSRITSADDTLRRADAEVYARVLAGVAHGLYGFIAWVAEQILPDQCGEWMLARWCSMYGIVRKDAAAATGSVTFTVQAGASIPAGSALQALDGTEYTTTADAVVAGTAATAMVVASAAGVAGNRISGESLRLVSPIDGVQPTALAGELSGGADLEEIEDWRLRLLRRIRKPPQGGSLDDYETWALEVAGVTRAWATRGEMGAGTVTVRFVRDNDGTGSAILPSAGEVESVQAYIDERRPAGTKQVYVVAPLAQVVDFTFSSLEPDTSTVRAAVEAELADLLLREATPGGRVPLSHIRAAVSAAAGENNYVLADPSADVISSTGYMAIMGAVTWP